MELSRLWRHCGDDHSVLELVLSAQNRTDSSSSRESLEIPVVGLLLIVSRNYLTLDRWKSGNTFVACYWWIRISFSKICSIWIDHSSKLTLHFKSVTSFVYPNSCCSNTFFIFVEYPTSTTKKNKDRMLRASKRFVPVLHEGRQFGSKASKNLR